MLAQNHSFIERMATFAFDKHRAYYKHNNASSRNRDVREWVVQKEGGSKWRDSLKEGDQVDVLVMLVDVDCETGYGEFKRKYYHSEHWRQVVISTITEDSDCLSLSFPTCR